MRILVANPLWPHPRHTLLSANVIFFELLVALSKQPGVKAGFLKINPDGDKKNSDQEGAGMQELKQAGIEVLRPLDLPPQPAPRSVLARLVSPKVTDYYPQAASRSRAHEAIKEFAPDIIFIPLAEWTTVLFSQAPAFKFAYYGNPDSKSWRARLMFNWRHTHMRLVDFISQYFFSHYLEYFHLREMKKYDLIGNVAANDALYYARKGHPHSIYTRLAWIDRMGTGWRLKKEQSEEKSPVKICGNIGRLAATANTHGLEVLGRDILPELAQIMKIPYEVHLFGSGEAHPAVAPLLRRPEIRMRGFVDDIDGEIISSHIFLCANNASSYKVCHTRYLHAWSLGCCVVAHKDAALSIPEMQHGKNALLGNSPREIAELVGKASTDETLRKRIGEGGYETFHDLFTAEKVVPDIMREINAHRAHAHLN